MSLGNYILQAEQKLLKAYPSKEKLRIVEVGAGTGSAAESILFYFQNFCQQHFRNVQYHIVEISPVLCEYMEKKLKKIYPKHFEEGYIKIFNLDINKYTNNNRCYLIFLEVLDNLPHDKVIFNKQKNTYQQFCNVNLNTMEQKYIHVSKDSLVKECLDLYLKSQIASSNKNIGLDKGVLNRIAEKVFQLLFVKKTSTQELFLPTHLLQLMKNIKKNIPQAYAIISDFDNLASKIPGKGAPIVSFKGEKSHEKKDYDSYLVERGAADIFFPVDFNFLKYLHSVYFSKDANVVKSYQFFQEFGLENWTVSRSGFNPLKEDYSNTSFLLTKV